MKALIDTLEQTDTIFYDNTTLDQARVEGIVHDALHRSDDGELFLEYCQSETLGFDDGQLKTASSETTQGFGLRLVLGETTSLAHASDLSEDAIRRAANSVQAIRQGYDGTVMQAMPPLGINHRLYEPNNPLDTLDFSARVQLLQTMDAWTRARDPRVKQVSISVNGEWQAVQIVRSDAPRVGDIRPLVRLDISVILEQNGRMEGGSYGYGGRGLFDEWVKDDMWQGAVDEAIRQASVNLESVPAPAGEVAVVLGNGWPGILLHEAVGHGLEGDFNRKQTSAFAGLMGERIAAKGVHVVDDATIPGRRGSLNVDDEGTPGQYTPLIEDGILCGYLHDRLNAQLMGNLSTGNGRRESYAHTPLPRMTNTIMLGGEEVPEDIVRSVDKGVYAVSFGGGQVDITSGQFVFSCTEAYEIENGKIGRPLKGATLIGNGPDVMTKVSKIGCDMALDPGIGTCGKDGQGVPVGVGQPTLLVDEMTVGGTAV